MNNNKKELLKPKYDVVFHSLFRKDNSNITSGFLTDILQKETKVIDMDKDRYLATKYPNEKLGILDLKIELAGGIKCNIEIQLANQYNIIKRLLYYWSKVYAEELKEGEDYKELKKTIGIVIIDYELKELREIEELGIKWQIRDSQSGKKLLTEDLELYILEIPKAKRKLEKEKENKIAQWMAFLDNPNSKEVSEIMGKNKNIKNAMEELEEMSEDEELRRVAELKEKYIRDEINMRRGALEDGFNEGMQKGIKEGGKLKQKEIAKNMIKNGIQINDIVKMTGLSKKEIENI